MICEKKGIYLSPKKNWTREIILHYRRRHSYAKHRGIIFKEIYIYVCKNERIGHGKKLFGFTDGEIMMQNNGA